MAENAKKSPLPRSAYIPAVLSRYCLNGDAFVYAADVYHVCCGDKPTISYNDFCVDLAEQVRLGGVIRDGNRIYLSRTFRYEIAAAGYLSRMLQNNETYCPPVPNPLLIGDLYMTKAQRNAVIMALSHRLSLILGGAGSGKTTLIRAIAKQYGSPITSVLTAPTGKAARNLNNRTHLEARTVHSTLGMRPDDDFLSPVVWERIGLVIVDEASMMTLEMLAGILCKVRWDCRVVLLGDPNQLQSVGSGNILPDLLALGIPCTRLETNHRQAESGVGLQKNVVGFSHCLSLRDLVFDESFVLNRIDEPHIMDALVQEASRLYLDGESVQVLSPYNRSTMLSVEALNEALQQAVNPSTPEKKELHFKGHLFRDGDRVIITRNDRDKNCSNGDVGTLRVLDDNQNHPVYCVLLSDGRVPAWEGAGGLADLALAYAITVHKAQGSEYDTILMPITNSFHSMMYRNLIYTSISRAKKQVQLYGSANALGIALQVSPRKRNSMLVTKTRWECRKKAA